MRNLAVYLLFPLCGSVAITSAASAFDWRSYIKQWIPHKDVKDPSPTSTLIKLAILHRHGDRVSEHAFKTDPYPCTDLSIWPDGEGQLTIRGKKRMLGVGKLIRKRYDQFLGDNPIIVYAQSSPVDRCLNSAQLVLTGAYPPTGRLVFEKSLKWQPIPIHTSSPEFEQMLITPSKMRCAASSAAKWLQLQAPDVKEYDEENREFLDLLSANTGENITGVIDVHPVYDSLNIAHEYRKKWPDWVTDEVFGKLEHMDSINNCLNSSTNQILRLDSGVFLHDLKEKFENKFVTDYVEKRVFFYSAHDSKLMPVMKAIGIWDGKNPGYGNAIIFELHRIPDPGNNANDTLVVRTYHLPDTNSGSFERKTTRGCPVNEKDCDVRLFFDSLKDFITDPQTHERECRNVPTKPVQPSGCF
jgi:hypothetical protein